MHNLLKYLKLFERDKSLNVLHFASLSDILYLG